MEKPTVDQVHKALWKILDNQTEKSLNYCINYADYGISTNDPDELRVQCLYVLNNMTHWRGETATEVRTVLKAFCGIK